VASTRDELFSAIDANDLRRVRPLIDRDPALPSALDDDGRSALDHASAAGDEATIEAIRAGLG
jgi:ankyrin repeat protein